ncbi:hypothetical protein KIPB_009128, partial [Kipferlia bialata]
NGWALIAESGIASHFTRVRYRQLRLLYIELVIETDPSSNFDFTRRNVTLDRVVHTMQWESVEGALAAFLQSPDEKAIASTRFTLLALIIKLADLSNPFRPREVAVIYAECVMREFFNQGDKELIYDHSIALPPHQDRYAYPGNMNTCQVSFIRGLVLPLLKLFTDTMDALGTVSSDTLLQEIKANVEMNLKAWEGNDEAQMQRERERLQYATPQKPKTLPPLPNAEKEPSRDGEGERG